MDEEITEDEEREIKEMLENQSLETAVEKIKEYLEQLDHVELNIAVTGASGAGKSTFVNALRGLKNGSPGAAPTGPVQTIMESVMYPQPSHPMVKLWDLPGIGTPNFKADEYLRKVQFQRYDFFIILSSERFRESDVQLATEIQHVKKKFYFVRSKIDDCLRAEAESLGFNKDKTLELIRKDCIEGLQKTGVESPMVFLISSFGLQLYDFQKLVSTIEEELPKHKRDVLRRSLPNISQEINRRKKESLQKNIWRVAFVSGCAAAVPIPGLSYMVDMVILVKVLRKYCQDFGLDNKSLENLSKKTNVPLPELKACLKSPLNKEISTDVVIKLLTKFAGGGLMLLKFVFSAVPLFGSLVAASISFHTTYKLLQYCLNELAEDAHRVLMRTLQTEL